MATYAVIDSGGNVVNRIEWDGVTPYTPPPRITLIPDANDESWIGGKYDGSQFSGRPGPNVVSVTLTQEQRENQAIEIQARADAARKLGLISRADTLDAQALQTLTGGS